VGRAWTSTPANARGLPRSWSKAESACERSPSPKLPKAKEPPQPGASSGRLPPFQAIMVCERSRFEGASVACG